MKRVIVTGEYLNTLPLPHTRPYMVELVFKAAKDKNWAVSMPGEHWSV